MLGIGFPIKEEESMSGDESVKESNSDSLMEDNDQIPFDAFNL
jgi:hypothetical protein